MKREINPGIVAVIIGLLVVALLGFGWKFFFGSAPKAEDPAKIAPQLGWIRNAPSAFRAADG